MSSAWRATAPIGMSRTSAVGCLPGRRHHPRDEGRLYGVAERVEELLVLDHSRPTLSAHASAT
jgi:hypothetical protein